MHRWLPIVVLAAAVACELVASVRLFARVGTAFSPELVVLLAPALLAGLIGLNIVLRSQTMSMRSAGVGLAIVLLALHYSWATTIYDWMFPGIVFAGCILASVVLFPIYMFLVITDNE